MPRGVGEAEHVAALVKSAGCLWLHANQIQLDLFRLENKLRPMISEETIKTCQKLGGEYLREISALVLVFGFLDGFDKFFVLDLESSLLILLISLATFVVGCILGLRSK
jgi:hypothetical protein